MARQMITPSHAVVGTCTGPRVQITALHPGLDFHIIWAVQVQTICGWYHNVFVESNVPLVKGSDAEISNGRAASVIPCSPEGWCAGPFGYESDHFVPACLPFLAVSWASQRILNILVSHDLRKVFGLVAAKRLPMEQ